MDLQAFLARVAHDLKSPARQMGSILQLLTADANFSEEQKQIADMLRVVAEKGVLQVEGLSRFAQCIKNDGSRCSLKIVDVLNQVLKQHKPLAVSGADSLQLDIDFNLQALKVILEEVLSNAVKYCPDGCQPEVQISVDRAADSNAQVICFSSPSIGVQHEQLDKLLAPYARDTRSSAIEGHGMGLCIVSYLVDQSGGKLWLQCDETRFSVYWQLAQSVAQDMSNAA